jgi:hypothetical protein
VAARGAAADTAAAGTLASVLDSLTRPAPPPPPPPRSPSAHEIPVDEDP